MQSSRAPSSSCHTHTHTHTPVLSMWNKQSTALHGVHPPGGPVRWFVHGHGHAAPVLSMRWGDPRSSHHPPGILLLFILFFHTLSGVGQRIWHTAAISGSATAHRYGGQPICPIKNQHVAQRTTGPGPFLRFPRCSLYVSVQHSAEAVGYGLRRPCSPCCRCKWMDGQGYS